MIPGLPPDAPEWLRHIVSDSQARIDELHAQLDEETDADRRDELAAQIQAELVSLDGWLTPRPVDADVVAAVIERDRMTLEG